MNGFTDIEPARPEMSYGIAVPFQDGVRIVLRGVAAPYRERARVHQPAIGKARVWSSRTKSTTDHQAHLRRAAEDAMEGRPPLQCPVCLVARFFFAPPPSWPKWKRQLLDAGLLAHSQKPDWDNLRKAAVDALKGVVIADDALICQESSLSGKFWSETPRTEIFVSPLEQFPSQIRTRPPGSRPPLPIARSNLQQTASTEEKR
ncbi:MAG: RusA family crossover junction endodeoxyribonuclease [Alphaproteobacteria bacterium]